MPNHINGSQICYNGLSYDELARIFVEAESEVTLTEGEWRTIDPIHKGDIYQGLKAVFTAIQNETEAQHEENIADPAEAKADAMIEEADAERRYGK